MLFVDQSGVGLLLSPHVVSLRIVLAFDVALILNGRLLFTHYLLLALLNEPKLAGFFGHTFRLFNESVLFVFKVVYLSKARSSEELTFNFGDLFLESAKELFLGLFSFYK